MRIVLTQGFTTDLEVTIMEEGKAPVKKVYDALQGIEAAQDFIQEHTSTTREYEIITKGYTHGIQELLSLLSQQQRVEAPNVKESAERRD